MLKNPFFLNKGPFTLKKIFNECQIIFKTIDKKIVIEDVKDLKNSTNNDLTFFHSIKYKDLAINTSIESNELLWFTILDLEIQESIKNELLYKCDELKCMNSHDDEYTKLKTWLLMLIDKVNIPNIIKNQYIISLQNI